MITPVLSIYLSQVTLIYYTPLHLIFQNVHEGIFYMQLSYSLISPHKRGNCTKIYIYIYIYTETKKIFFFFFFPSSFPSPLSIYIKKKQGRRKGKKISGRQNCPPTQCSCPLCPHFFFFFFLFHNVLSIRFLFIYLFIYSFTSFFLFFFTCP